jgi:hypothetical protein
MRKFQQEHLRLRANRDLKRVLKRSHEHGDVCLECGFCMTVASKDMELPPAHLDY